MVPRPRLRLSAHVRACQCDAQVILFDLRRSKFIGVSGPRLHTLSHAVEGWPGYPAKDLATDPADIDALTRPLVSQGLLTTRIGDHALSHPSIGEAMSSLNAEDSNQNAKIGPRRLYRFVYAVAISSIGLRHFSMLSIARHVARHRARQESRARSIPPDTLGNAVGAFQKLRPLVFTAQDRCLHDSLSLVHFLAREGHFPRWVIGVTTRPFGAHSWVQEGAIVLNGLHEHVRRFTPILVV